MACFWAYFGGFNQHYALTLRQIEPVPFPFVGTRVQSYLKHPKASLSSLILTLPRWLNGSMKPPESLNAITPLLGIFLSSLERRKTWHTQKSLKSAQALKPGRSWWTKGLMREKSDSIQSDVTVANVAGYSISLSIIPNTNGAPERTKLNIN